MSFLDELYYGNINPNENRNRKKLPYEKALKTFSDIESKLTKELNGENLKLFNELVNASELTIKIPRVICCKMSLLGIFFSKCRLNLSKVIDF